MSPIRVHGTPFSGPVARVLCCLYEKDIDFEFVAVDLRTGEHKKEPYISLNPFGQVPGFEDGDLSLFESRAITQYLVYAYPEKGAHLIPSDKKEMGTTLTWMNVEAHQYDPPAAKLSFELFTKSFLGIGAPDAAAAAENEAKLGKVLDIYEAKLSKTKYLAGDCFTLADLHHLPTLTYLMPTDAKKLFESRPHVNLWVKDIMCRPSWGKVLAMRNTACRSICLIVCLVQ